MQEVIILTGGIHYYHNMQGTPMDVYVVYPHENIESLRKFIGLPINNLGHFPGVDSSSIVQDVQVKSNNVVAMVSGK